MITAVTKIELGVNIDHVATVREARKTNEPDPVWAGTLAELGGADGITVHLREDRRHIQDRDVRLLRETVRCKLNLEMATSSEIVSIACDVRPDQATLVPERREEVTTEGGLDLLTHRDAVYEAVQRLKSCGICVSLFLDPEPAMIDAAAELRVEAVELHTGQYALAHNNTAHNNTAHNNTAQQRELLRLQSAASSIVAAGMRLHAGHGLTYHNVRPIAAIPQMRELNIGHSIIARALMVGMTAAVREMKQILDLTPQVLQ